MGLLLVGLLRSCRPLRTQSYRYRPDLDLPFPTSCYGEHTRTALECKVTPLELSLLKWGVKWVVGF